jgi:hypothetical protein
MIWLIKILFKTIFKITSGLLGFTTAMALGPGLMFFMYAYEPHNPLPDIIADLPADKVEASQVMQYRIDLLLNHNSELGNVTTYLSEKGFAVDLVDNNAVYHRRQLDCIESYVIVWTENGLRVRKAATLFEVSCPGIAKNI